MKINRSHHLMLKAIQAVEAARPANGLYPVTPEEICRTLAANVALGTAMFVESGLSEGEAKSLSQAINGGRAGRLMLELSIEVAKECGQQETAEQGNCDV
jgi:hypothetical protein